MTDFLKLAQEAYDASTTYIDSNYRTDWDYSIRAFRSEHAAGSKYLSEDYKSRSRIVSPKTRSIIRKNEAAAMQAAFSNREVVHCEAANPDDPLSVASAITLKEAMEYRLSKTIPTFQIYCGGVQDAQTMGAVCSYQYWEYEKRNGKKIKDKPCIELRPLENIRFDAGASWLDPVNTSPYFCDIIPMYVCDVKAMMTNKDDKTGSPKWKKFDDKIISQARPDIMDTTRKARIGNKQDPIDQTSSIKDFDIVWVMRWFMKSNGDEWVFYTLGTEQILSTPKPLDEVYFHGVRPYVMGYAILETHKAFKSSMPILVKSVQLESTDIRNQRLDNVKYVLNKRMYVARGRQVDTGALVRNVPGAVILMNDPKSDVIESNHADVTSSSFVEHDRLNSEFDDLAGNFSPSTKVANNAVNDTLGGSKMAAAGAGLMTEYLLHTINMTWWEPVMQQLGLLERYYETDEVILAICAQKARLFPRFGPGQLSQLLLANDVGVSVNMATGDPAQRFSKFMAATNAALQLRSNPAPGLNVNEATDEIYANAGYKSSARFFNSKQDPQVAHLMQMVKQLKGALDGKQMELQHQGQLEQMKVQSNEKIQGAKLQVDHARISGDLQIRQSELQLQDKKLQIEAAKVNADAQKGDPPVNPLMEQAEIADKMAHVDLQIAQADKARKEADVAVQSAVADIVKTKTETAAIAAPVIDQNQVAENNTRDLDDIKQGLQSVYDAMQETFNQHATTQSQGLDYVKNDISRLTDGLHQVAQTIMQPKKKPVGFSLRKGQDKKTQAVVVSFDDGSQEHMPVQ